MNQIIKCLRIYTILVMLLFFGVINLKLLVIWLSPFVQMCFSQITKQSAGSLWDIG